MQDFLNEISEDLIQERVNRLKQKIETEKKTIFNKIYSYRKQFLNSFNSKIHKKSSGENLQNNEQIKNLFSLMRNSQYQEVNVACTTKELNLQQNPTNFFDQKQSENCFMVFERACQNILETYFPILMNYEMLSLQSEEYVLCYCRQIDQKLLYLNSVVEKTAVNLIKKLTKPDQLLAQIKKDCLIEEEQMLKQESQIEISCENNEKTRKTKTKKTKKDRKDGKKGKSTKIPTESTYVMQKWLLQNFHDPYPTMQHKSAMAQQNGLTVCQVNNWFINARQRVIKKYLKKDSVSNQPNNKSRKNSSQDEQYNGGKRENKSGRRQNNSKSQYSEGSLNGNKSSQEKEEMLEES